MNSVFQAHRSTDALHNSGQSILEHCGGRSLNEQRIDNAPLPFGHGLVRFAVYVTLRWEDKSKAILLPHHKALCVHSSIMCPRKFAFLFMR
jgi:hypothetical protein